MAKEIKIGVVGAAGRGRSFFSAINNNPHAQVTAICDINEEGLGKAVEDSGAEESYTDYGQMLEKGNVDAVLIGTPMHLHVPQAIEALEQDVHVMVEVPVGVSIEECRYLVGAKKKSRATFMMAENYCYIRENVLVGQIARAGLFGDPYFGEGEYVHELKGLNEITKWRRKWQTGINGNTYPTHSFGPVYQWFNGQRAVKVSCFGTGHHYQDPRGDYYEQEDSITTACRLEGGGLVNLRLDMLSNRPAHCAYYSLQGTKGCYEAPRGHGDNHKVFLTDRHEWESWNDLSDLAEEFLPEKWLNPPKEALESGHWGGDYMVVQDFVEAVLNGTEPPIGIHEALDMTLVGLVSQQSIEQDSAWLDVPDSRDW